MNEREHDVRAIEALISRQFGSLCWPAGGVGDWAAFAADFLPGATLYAAARPAASQTVTAFVERMKRLCGTSLRSFHETVLGSRVHLFGNIAVAVVAAEMTENEAGASRNVEMMLLVKTDGAWRIVAQAWDRASDANPLLRDIVADPG